MEQGYWREIWEGKAQEPDFAASGRSSGDPTQLFALLSDASAALELKATDRLLDLGCGVGLLGRHLVPYVSSFVGTDFAIPLLRRARQHSAGASWIGAGILQLPFRSQSFTKVLASSVLQYLGNDDNVAEALSEMRRVVSPGARVFASGNPDRRRKTEYIAGIDVLDLSNEKKALIRERNQNAFWLSPDLVLEQARGCGWTAEVRPISSSVWQSFYMFDLLLSAR